MSNPKVLVVEDSKELRDIIKSVLESAGFEVEAVDNPKPAIQKLKETKFSAIITDNDMPEMSGSEFLTVLKASGIPTPAYMVSGSQDPNLAEWVRKIGYKFFEKPDFLTAIKEIKAMLLV